MNQPAFHHFPTFTHNPHEDAIIAGVLTDWRFDATDPNRAQPLAQRAALFRAAQAFAREKIDYVGDGRPYDEYLIIEAVDGFGGVTPHFHLQLKGYGRIERIALPTPAWAREAPYNIKRDYIQLNKWTGRELYERHERLAWAALQAAGVAPKPADESTLFTLLAQLSRPVAAVLEPSKQVSLWAKAWATIRSTEGWRRRPARPTRPKGMKKKRWEAILDIAAIAEAHGPGPRLRTEWAALSRARWAKSHSSSLRTMISLADSGYMVEYQRIPDTPYSFTWLGFAT